VSFITTTGKKVSRHDVLYFFPPLKTLAGRVIIALRRSKTAWTVIPRSRKGNKRSHTRGYKIKANKARGQHKTSRISQRRNFTIADPPRR
jgi:hypothetical protein